MKGTTYLVGRAVLAVLLMLAFYGLALLMILLLLGVLYLETRFKRFNLQITFFCLTSMYVIAKAVVPRREHFTAPGPRLGPEAQPRLFQELRGVAAATGQVMPAEVYLVFDVNAGVTQRGGLMGFGSRRVMLLGLPLMQVLGLDEFRGVIAHEFGHFHGGDVRVGPWIYQTRAALLRALRDVGRHGGAILAAPFSLYAELFFRVTLSLSRHQELLADALATRVAGAAALARGLRATHAAGLVFPPYLFHSVDPVVVAGFQPPLAEGFAMVMQRPEIGKGIAEALDKEMKEGTATPYDTHPPLRERLAALGAEAGPSLPGDLPRADSLLEAVPDLESALAVHWARHRPRPEEDGPDPAPGVTSLPRVEWGEVGARVVVPSWREFIPQFARALAGLTPAALPTADWTTLGDRLAPCQPDEHKREAVDTVIGIALALALVRAGYAVDAQPGAPVSLVRGDERVDPWKVRARLSGSPEEREAWSRFVARAGIAEEDLGALAKAAR